MADLEATRTLLDDAAVALHDADHVRGEVDQARAPHGTRLALDARDVMANLRAVRKTLDRMSERLAIRLGPDHEAVDQFRAANTALRVMYEEKDLPPSMIKFSEQHKALDAAYARFDAARTGFLTAAAKTAGAQLPS